MPPYIIRQYAILGPSFLPVGRLWLHVVDLVILLKNARIQENVALVIALLSALGVPISWRKAQLGAEITWCGWTFNFDCETVHLTAEKVTKLGAQLRELRNSKKNLRKKLESSLYRTPHVGHQHSQAFAPLPGTALQGSTFRQRHLEADPPLAVAAFLGLLELRGSGLQTAYRSLVANARSHHGSVDVHCKADIPKVPPAHKAPWVCIADPHRTEIHLRDESRNAIDWLSMCFAHDRVRSLRQRPLLQCYAAADAMAQGNPIGIGGWIITSTTVAWVSLNNTTWLKYVRSGPHCTTRHRNTRWHSWRAQPSIGPSHCRRPRTMLPPRLWSTAEPL